METFSSTQEKSASLNETNDCSVKALSIAAGIDYIEMNGIFTLHGRERRKGTYNHTFVDVLDHLKRTGRIKGWEKSMPRRHYMRKVKRGMGTVEKPYAGKFSMKTIGTELPKGHYVVEMSRHHAAMVDGKIEDWSEGRKKLVNEVYKIIR